MTPSFFSHPRALLNRREWLHAGALGGLGLTLPQLLGAETTARTGGVKSCIFIFPWGGPAQQDTFDMKPDAPAEIRGEFKPIASSVPGIQICEHLPRLARLANLFTIIRSASHTTSNHNPGAYYALTGHAPERNVIELSPSRRDWPGVGSILAKLKPVQKTIPPCVLLPVPIQDGDNPTPGQHAGFLGPGFDPLIIKADRGQPPRFAIPELTPCVEPDRLEARRALFGDLTAHLKGWADTAAVQSLDVHRERAYDLMSSPACQKAFDLSREPLPLRERYGLNRHGQSVLLARRLTEAGVRLVLVNDADEKTTNRWDMHGKIFASLKGTLPETDAALSSLLEDLRDRGLLESTLVVWMGEFGRTRLGHQLPDGRDHWPRCYSLLLAGGGIRGGQVYGASDSRAEYPRDNPCSPEDIHATIHHALGVPPDTIIQDALGRPMALCSGRPLTELFTKS